MTITSVGATPRIVLSGVAAEGDAWRRLLPLGVAPTTGLCAVSDFHAEYLRSPTSNGKNSARILVRKTDRKSDRYAVSFFIRCRRARPKIKRLQHLY